MKRANKSIKLNNHLRFGYWLLLIGLVIGYSSFASAKEYDGIWFLGFNLNKTPFDNLKVRQAVAHALDKEFIAKQIVGEEIVPTSFIPPGMEGYADFKPYKLNIKYAKTLMKRAKYFPNDPRLKKITLLHTDGVKTIEIAKKIKDDLKQIGISVESFQVSYRDEEKWNRELAFKNHHLFLMGYKSEIEKLFTKEATEKVSDSYLLLEPLFHSKGAANFGNYQNSNVDMLLDQISVIGPTFLKERELKLKEVNKNLYRDLPAIVLFYIEKL